jgi:GT2 family glycosyltransferase
VDSAAVHADAEAPRIAICVATYRRARGLLALLQSLDTLVFTGAAPEVRIVVADNDEFESARAICEDARHWLRHPLRYVVEKRRGIPQARNASVAPALGWASWIAFVDDDEVVDPHWLDALLAVQRATGADVVNGPVIPRYAMDAPRWVVDGAFFSTPQLADREPRLRAYTGNAMVRASALAGLERLFDERLVLGEDTDLFGRLVRSRHRIVWAERARIFTDVPADRTRLRWILARAYRDGIALARIERRHGLRSAAWIALHGAYCLAGGLCRAAVPARCGFGARARALERAAYGLGRWAGLRSPRHA